MVHTIICKTKDLVENSGVCALVNYQGYEQQVALFYLPNSKQKVFALANWDPIGQANVISRGIVGSVGEEMVVASPLYKQHFSLLTGKCLDDEASVQTYAVEINGDDVVLIS